LIKERAKLKKRKFDKALNQKDNKQILRKKYIQIKNGIQHKNRELLMTDQQRNQMLANDREQHKLKEKSMTEQERNQMLANDREQEYMKK